jgi:small-conductance mechanosensitive channel
MSNILANVDRSVDGTSQFLDHPASLLRQMLLPDIKPRFDAEGIEIPFPHRTIYTGSATTPFPVSQVGE